MLLHEARWLRAELARIETARLGRVVSIGSGSRDFRERRQPWIQREVFAPLDARGVQVVHHEYHLDDGVDIAGDITDPDVVQQVAAAQPETILLCNVLEHVQEPTKLADALIDLLPAGGLLVVTVPRRFPYHPDPLDTMLRPDLNELDQVLGPRVRRRRGAEVRCESLGMYWLRSPDKVSALKKGARPPALPETAAAPPTLTSRLREALIDTTTTCAIYERIDPAQVGFVSENFQSRAEEHAAMPKQPTATRERIRRVIPYKATRWLRRAVEHVSYPSDLDPAGLALYSDVAPFTMTCPERVVALRDAVHHVVEQRIPGSIVECGVWRGGSMMVVAKTLLERGDVRDLYLFDTYQGMSEPTEHDVAHSGEPAERLLADAAKSTGRNIWCIAGLDDVQTNVLGTGYPSDRVRFVEGKVEDMLVDHAPEQIALLRLDTDFYESTKHELEVLYPRLAPGGVIIIDDYGHWQGARKAVDEYFDTHGDRPMLFRVDYTCRAGIKR